MQSENLKQSLKPSSICGRCFESLGVTWIDKEAEKIPLTTLSGVGLICRFICLLLFLTGISSQLQSQDSMKTTVALLDTTYVKYADFRDVLVTWKTEMNNVKEAYEQIEKQIDDEHSKIGQELQHWKTSIESLGVQFDKLEKEKIAKLKEEILETVAFINIAGSSLDAISNQLSNTELLNQITSLNNVTSGELGFSIEKVLMHLNDKHINSKIGSRKAEKVNSFVKDILHSPLTNLANGLFPVINSITSFISNISFSSKNISNEDFNSYLRDLSKYTAYYEKLYILNIEFNNGVNQIKTRTVALESRIRKFIIERLKKTTSSNNFSVTDGVPLELLIDNYYTKENLKEEFKLIQTNSKTWRSIATELEKIQPKYVLSQLQSFRDEISNLSSQYLATVKSYQKELTTLIESSGELVISPSKESEADRSQTISSLHTKFKAANDSFIKAIKLSRLEKTYGEVINYDEE